MTTISTKQTAPAPHRSADPVSWLQKKNNRLEKELSGLQEDYKKLQEDFEHVIKQFGLNK